MTKQNQTFNQEDIIHYKYDQIRTKESLKKHPRMTREERAKIFMPFAALTGFGEAILEKQIIKIQKKSLSEEKNEEINNEIINIQKLLRKNIQVHVKVLYFSSKYEKYNQLEGQVLRLDSYRKLMVVNSQDECNTEKKSKYIIEKPSQISKEEVEINYEDIYEIIIE